MSHASRLRSFDVPLCHKHHDHGDHGGPGHEHAHDAGASHDPARGVGPHDEHGDAHPSESPHSHGSVAAGTHTIRGAGSDVGGGVLSAGPEWRGRGPGRRPGATRFPSPPWGTKLPVEGHVAAGRRA